MKTSPIAILAVATLGLAYGQPASRKCDYGADVADQLHSMYKEIFACKDATGYNMAPPVAMPTPEQQKGICTKCADFVQVVSPMKWPDCWMKIAGKEQTFTDYFDAITGPCRGTTSPSPSPSPSPTSATPSPSPTTDAPAPPGLEQCSYSAVSPMLKTISTQLNSCKNATSYDMSPPKVMPTSEQQQGICNKCTDFIKVVEPIQWPNCWMTLAGKKQTLASFFGSVTEPCKKPTPTSSGPTPTSSAPTPAPKPSC